MFIPIQYQFDLRLTALSLELLNRNLPVVRHN